MQTRYYRVGDHPLSISFVRDEDADALLPSFARFRTAAAPDEPLLLRVEVDDRLPWDAPQHEVGRFDSPGNTYGVYLRPDGGYQFEITDVQGVLCARVTTNADFSHVAVALTGGQYSQRNFGLNNTLMLSYAFASADRLTLLMHASVIRHDGKGYLMTAPSGTGKSTHTRLWYDNIPGCDLMNDDNPVVRIWPDGQVIVYGSPWSGKTPCYRNIQAPVGAIVRIQQRPENSIRELRPTDAFGMLLPQMSSMKWDARVHRGVCDSIVELVRLCHIYELGCLPNADAARLCYETVSR